MDRDESNFLAADREDPNFAYSDYLKKITLLVGQATFLAVFYPRPHGLVTLQRFFTETIDFLTFLLSDFFGGRGGSENQENTFRPRFIGNFLKHLGG